MSIQVPGTGPNPQLEGLDDFWVGVSANFLNLPTPLAKLKNLTCCLSFYRKDGRALDQDPITSLVYAVVV
jgi:hypothetical protein